MDINYANACTEVLTLFEYFLDEEELNKIPKEQMDHIKNISNQDYVYNIDFNKGLDEQEISKEARAIILSLYLKYFADDTKRAKINLYLRKNKEANFTPNENIKQADEIFNKKHEEKIEKEIEEQSNAKSFSLVIREQTLLQRIFNKIKKLFRRKDRF